jgi:hypothetical protein
MVLDWTVFYVNLLLILHASQTIAFLKGSVVEMTNAADQFTRSIGRAWTPVFFLDLGEIMPFSFTTEVGTCFRIRLLLFRIRKLPYFIEFSDHNLVFR